MPILFSLTVTQYPDRLKATTCIREEHAAAAAWEKERKQVTTSWSRQDMECTKKDLKTMFYLAHGCHAALDAPKKAPSEGNHSFSPRQVDSATVDAVTRRRWQKAGFKQNSTRLPQILGKRLMNRLPTDMTARVHLAQMDSTQCWHNSASTSQFFANCFSTG